MSRPPLRRILCIEDDPDILAVAELALAAVGGFEVRLCPSGELAVAAVREFCPDLVLLDVMMPGLDGPATLGRLRESPDTSRVPVAFMTARTQPADLEELRATGAIGVLPKPFDPLHLAEEVRALWSQIRSEERPLLPGG